MAHVEASCPACGGPIQFKIGSSVVVVCEFCSSVIARGDRKLEDLGKVAELVATESPLDLGLKGKFRGAAFELDGRAQLAHAAGGIWDEWYLAFQDGRWGWLAEAQGRFYLTLEKELSSDSEPRDGHVDSDSTASAVPPFDALVLGEAVPGLPAGHKWIVAEVGEARRLGAAGEIPYRLEPGASYSYADLSAQDGAFATLDYGDSPPTFYIGREVTLDELGVPKSARAPERDAQQIAALQLSCPQCGGALDLRAPDKSERVTCPNCNSLLDVAQGKLAFFKTLREHDLKPVIPIGSTAEFDGAPLTVIGFLQRSVVLDGARYFWEEYLLYNPRVGFRWLVRSDNHFSFVHSVPAGDVAADGGVARFGGQKFDLFQDATARVDHVEGEFYWRVEAGEKVFASDFIRPPLMLSREVSRVGGTDAPAAADAMLGKKKGKQRKAARGAVPACAVEINWSVGRYVPVAEIERLFKLTGLPRPTTVAPNQPFPHRDIHRYWRWLIAAAAVLAIIVTVTRSRRPVFTQQYQLQPLASANGTQVMFSEPLELRSLQNVRVAAAASVNNSWLYLEGDFYNEETGLVQPFGLPIEYYYGVDGGENWSEGSQRSSVMLSALPAGKYTLRLECNWEHWQQPATVSVEVEQGVTPWSHLVWVLGLLTAVPAILRMRQFNFDKRRWEDSSFNPYVEGDDSE